MVKKVVLLSGPVASGKTQLADALAERYDVRTFKTRRWIESLTEVHTERGALQRAGARLDRKYRGAWVAASLERGLEGLPQDSVVIVDSVRIKQQVDAVRRAHGPKVVHVHLTAPLAELRKRYTRRKARIREAATYARVRRDPTEQRVGRLADVADILIDTAKSAPADVVVRVAARIGLYGRRVDKLVDVLVGGQYGSEGKGHIASHLAPEYDVLVRVGGPNAGHTVYARPQNYTFIHLPSGTPRTGQHVKLVLGPGATLHVETLLDELNDFQITPRRLSIDPQAMIIEGSDVDGENKGNLKKIASTKKGVGWATSRKVLRSDANPPVRLAKDVKMLRPFIRESLPIFERAFGDGRKILLEGTQGTGLSLHHGEYPWVTSRETTAGGCLADAGIAPSRVRRIVMACRTYPIRVGGPSGPMKKLLSWAEISRRCKIPVRELRSAELTTRTKRLRRVGEFDWEMLRRSASLNGATDVALTFADYIHKGNQRARRFEQLTSETIRLIQEIERVASAPVSLIVTRFHYRSIIDRRAW